PVLSKALLDVPGIVGLTTGDFLEVTPDQYPAKFDRVLMNPPFSKGQDIQHVTHALRFLKPGGQLVAVMSTGVTSRQDKTTLAFCDLVWKRGGHITPLPDNAFAISGADVRTVLAVIPAPEE
ncbi:methyltransferase, partial [Nonomuraea antimicrobica]|uniref:methyltransferase n=1 Tax=Nonomuraea antimicrobica TaxID=561173 RepID=UPI0031ECA375